MGANGDIMTIHMGEMTVPWAAKPQTAGGWVGDVLVTFGTAGLPLGRRADAPWRAASVPGVWEAPPATDWKGSPITHLANEEWQVWLLGELYGPVRSDADVMAVASGQASPNRLNGHFLLLACDARAGEWHAWTNRLGTFHAYYATDGRRTALGTCFRAVAGMAARPDLDWEALTSFFGYGFCAADRTFLSDVRVLRPATHYHFGADGRLLSSERYWQWRHEPDHSRSAKATVDDFAERFQTVMDDLLANGRVAIPISGGLDSRSTVAAIRPGSAAIDRLWAYSYGYGHDSVETEIAAQVAAARRLDFDAFAVRPYLFTGLARVLASVEGFQDVTQARQASIAEEMGARSDFLIAAHLGDLLLDDMGVSGAPGSDELVEIAAHKFHKPGNAWLLEQVCRPHLGHAVPHEVMRDLLAAELARLPRLDDADYMVKLLKIDQWSARWTTASLRMFQSAAFPRLPFYDSRVVDYFSTVPTSAVAGRQVQIQYLRRHAPDLARVPWQATGRDLFNDGGFHPAHFARRVSRKLRTVITGNRVLERNWEVQFLGPVGQAGLREWLLRPGRRLHDYVPVDAVRELLAAFARDPWAEKRAYAVAQLLTFSAWLDYMAGDLN